MIWNNSQHDPLGIFISLPLSRHEPWRLRRTKTVVDVESSLQELPPDDFLQKGNILRIFLGSRGNWKPCQKAWCRSCYTRLEGDRFPVRLPKDEEGIFLVSEEDKFRFGEARPGDHLFCPFQCELCHFRNIQGRSPVMGKALLGDTELMKCLRRVNLDAFWSREPTTIKQNLGKINRVSQIAHEMGMRDPPIPKLGHWKLVDEFGPAAATIMVNHSLDPGVTETTVQFETVRKMKSAFVNLYQASVQNEISAVIGGKDGKNQLIMGVPIYYGWIDPKLGCIIEWETRWCMNMGFQNRRWWRCKLYWKRSGKPPETTREIG
jgi:hypothetical protein